MQKKESEGKTSKVLDGRWHSEGRQGEVGQRVNSLV